MVDKLSNKKTVVIGLSGGIDSAVSAYLLIKQGYNVIALFMQNWDSYLNNEHNFDSSSSKCEAQMDYEVAQAVAKFLNIPLFYKDFIKEYWDNVFKYFIFEYKNNRTPNPDILCNKFIKFDAFYKYAKETFHCDYIAMGHYAKVVHDGDLHYLALAKDEKKDQTYFLCELSSEQIKNVLFPLADLTKQEVRIIGKTINLPNANKKDSTGICFIGERNFKKFLENYIPHQPGKIVDITNNKVVGEHFGAMYYTIGQRKGLNLGGLKERYFVCSKDIATKTIFVAPNSLESKYLFSNCIVIKNFNWQYKPTSHTNILGRFRHGQKLQPVKVEFDNQAIIVTYQDQKNIVPGQYCVLYQDNICLGGGVIEQVLKK
ncbi:tRNA 2-thiouridine(34) synthase MnmA [bacterium]|nr:tRNA 2-thiouridine(34) synthase MnmA [bacterium]